MRQLHYFVMTNVAFIGMLYCVGIAEATGQDVITSMPSNALDTETHNNFTMKVYESNDNGCECIEYNCGCCQHLDWNALSMDGKLCVNASYLNNDYGFSLTVTYNNFAIFNETISARNPPPICFGEDIIDALDVEICLHVYDIDVTSDKFHACFEILGKLMKLPITKIKLGCVQTKLHKEIKYIENNWSLLFVKKTEDTVPNVIMV